MQPPGSSLLQLTGADTETDSLVLPATAAALSGACLTSILEDPESKGCGNSCRRDSEGGLTRPEPTHVSGQCVRTASSASLLRKCSDFALSPGDTQPVPTLHLRPGPGLRVAHRCTCACSLSGALKEDSPGGRVCRPTRVLGHEAEMNVSSEPPGPKHL